MKNYNDPNYKRLDGRTEAGEDVGDNELRGEGEDAEEEDAADRAAEAGKDEEEE